MRRKGFAWIAVILIVVAVLIVGAVLLVNSNGEFTPAYFMQRFINLDVPNTSYTSLYKCSINVLAATLPWDTESMITWAADSHDLLFVLNKETNAIYFYTPYYAGKSSINTDADGKPIAVADPSGGAGLVYYIRFPYAPPVGYRKGFYYTSFYDMPYGGHHDTRMALLNLPPTFLAGSAQDTPDFSNWNHGTGYPSTIVEFHPLSIENQIWASAPKETVDATSESELVSLTAARISNIQPDVQRERTAISMRAAPSVSEWQSASKPWLDAISSTCADAATKLNDQTLAQAVKSANL